jgi:hypothetical protein
MKLLGGRYAPITESIGFLEADFAQVVAADARWRAALGGYRGRPVGGPLPTLLEALLPLTGPLLRYVWVQTAGPWTAYFDNFVLGSDTFGPVSYLAQQLGCRGVSIRCREGTAMPRSVRCWTGSWRRWPPATSGSPTATFAPGPSCWGSPSGWASS